MRPQIELVTDRGQLAEAVDKLCAGEDYMTRFLGLDCDWSLILEKGVLPVPDLLQIGRADGFCVVVRLDILRCVPHPLRDLLEDRRYWKMGVGTVKDAENLKRGYGVDTQGVLDLRHLALALKIKPKGMTFLKKTVLGVKKPGFKNDYFWSRHDSSDDVHKCAVRAARIFQKLNIVRLALKWGDDWKKWGPPAEEAVNAARIFQRFNNKRLEQKWGDGWKQWGQERYERETYDLWEEFVGREFHYNDRFNDTDEYSWQESLE